MIHFDRRSIPAYIAVACLAIVVGYFAGREHLKYEIRSTFLAAFGGKSEKSETRPSRVEEVPTKKPVPTIEPSQIKARLLKKGYLPSSLEERRYGDSITMSMEFENAAGRDVRAFEGTLTFYDLLDNKILASNITINDPVKAGATYRWEGTLDYNQFMASHQKLRSEAQENLKTTYEVRKILFADGTTKELGR